MSKKKRSGRRVCQLKVTLAGIRPPIWRRIQVTGDTTLHELHWIIGTIMDWSGGHLHEFDVFGTPYGDPSEHMEDEVLDEKKVELRRLIEGEKQKFHYLYDFGDCWEHEILVEKILPVEKGTRYPICLKGKRAAPPEDCGGSPGYEELLEILRDPSHPEHEEMLEWLQGDFDPEKFDVEEMNGRLQPAGVKPGKA